MSTCERIVALSYLAQNRHCLQWGNLIMRHQIPLKIIEKKARSLPRVSSAAQASAEAKGLSQTSFSCSEVFFFSSLLPSAFSPRPQLHFHVAQAGPPWLWFAKLFSETLCDPPGCSHLYPERDGPMGCYWLHKGKRRRLRETWQIP